MDSEIVTFTMEGNQLKLLHTREQGFAEKKSSIA